VTSRYDTMTRLLARADRRVFLKALGLAGAGAVAGGGALRAVLGRDGGPLVSRTRLAMGTFVEVHAVYDRGVERGRGLSRDRADEAIALSFAEMDRLVGILSRHDPSSPTSRLNEHGSLRGAPSELSDVILAALAAHRLTGGAFDPTVGPLLDLLAASRRGDGPSAVEVRDAMALVGARHVQFADGGTIRLGREGMRLTLDGIAKGYVVDRMSDVLTAAGVTNHLVNAGGDIRTRGERSPGRPWTIAVQDPKKRRRYPDMIQLRNGAVATSGSYENFFDESRTRHHLVDPETGCSPCRLVSVSVCSPTVMDADALSTAVFVLGPDRGLGMIESTAHAATLLLDESRAWRSRRWNTLSRS
jgi:thiamine biosynthesis lipoprotein